MTTEQNQKLLFQFFTEVGIIQQLSTALFNRQLPDGLHVSHFTVLNHMVRLGDGKTPVSLASAFQVTKATMTNTLNALSTRALIRMEDNPRDRRSKTVYLTEEGREFHVAAIASLEPMFSNLAGAIDVSRLAEVTPFLEEVRSVLDDNRHW